MDPDGSDLKWLTDLSGSVLEASGSPDAPRILITYKADGAPSSRALLSAGALVSERAGFPTRGSRSVNADMVDQIRCAQASWQPGSRWSTSRVTRTRGAASGNGRSWRDR